MFIATVYRPSEDKLDAHAVFVSYLVHSKRILFGVHRPGLSRLTRENAYCEWIRQIRVYTQLEIETLKTYHWKGQRQTFCTSPSAPLHQFAQSVSFYTPAHVRVVRNKPRTCLQNTSLLIQLPLTGYQVIGHSYQSRGTKRSNAAIQARTTTAK